MLRQNKTGAEGENRELFGTSLCLRSSTQHKAVQIRSWRICELPTLWRGRPRGLSQIPLPMARYEVLPQRKSVTKPFGVTYGIYLSHIQGLYRLS